MENIFIALAIGMVAGIIDVVPMIIRKVDRLSCASAFMHWLALGLIIPFMDWPIQAWLKGMVIAMLTAIPVLIMVSAKDRKAIAPICLFSLLLGAGVGVAGAQFIG